MKRIVFFAVIGIFIFASCKKEKIEALGPKEKNDTTVTNPPYWCVKSAELYRKGANYVSYKFEYDDKSLLKVARVFWIDSNNNDTFESIINTYSYVGDKLIHRNCYRKTTLIQEELRTYEGGRIKSCEIKGYHLYDVSSNIYIMYEYDEATIKTKTVYKNADKIIPDTIHSVFQDYPDSSTAETKYIWTDIRPEPSYVFKEKLIKSNKNVILYGESFGDTVAIENRQNLINPIIWELFELYYRYTIYSNYIMKAAILDRTNNPYFYDVLANGYGTENQNLGKYYYDNTGKLNRITYGAKQSFHGEEPAFPIELKLTY